jgi:hypothetical protein
MSGMVAKQPEMLHMARAHRTQTDVDSQHHLNPASKYIVVNNNVILRGDKKSTFHTGKIVCIAERNEANGWQVVKANLPKISSTESFSLLAAQSVDLNKVSEEDFVGEFVDISAAQTVFDSAVANSPKSGSRESTMSPTNVPG